MKLSKNAPLDLIFTWTPIKIIWKCNNDIEWKVWGGGGCRILASDRVPPKCESPMSATDEGNTFIRPTQNNVQTFQVHGSLHQARAKLRGGKLAWGLPLVRAFRWDVGAGCRHWKGALWGSMHLTLPRSRKGTYNTSFLFFQTWGYVFLFPSAAVLGAMRPA